MQIQDILFTRTRGALLALFFLSPHQSFHVREALRRIDAGQGTTQREIQQLWKAGLLIRRRESNRVFYQANRDHFVFEPLRALLERTAGPVGEMHRALRSVRTNVDWAFIYGSIAKETAAASSDLDLMVVGRVSFEKIVKLVRPYQDKLGREINPSVYDREEFIKKLAEKDPFLHNIVTGPKKFVIGDSRELEKLV